MSKAVAQSSTNPTTTTTISILLADKNRLDRLKLHRREPYSEVLNRLLNDIERLKESGVKIPSSSVKAPQSYQSYLKAMIDSMTKSDPD